MAPASASEHTTSKFVIFFMVAVVWSLDGRDLFTRRTLLPAGASIAYAV
jgi:hypothetical protein